MLKLKCVLPYKPVNSDIKEILMYLVFNTVTVMVNLHPWSKVQGRLKSSNCLCLEPLLYITLGFILQGDSLLFNLHLRWVVYLESKAT